MGLCNRPCLSSYCLISKRVLHGAKPSNMSFTGKFHANETNFHLNIFAPGLSRCFETGKLNTTWKWPICIIHSTCTVY